MTAQYIVVALLDGSLAARVAGPFRSKPRAQAAAARIEAAGAWIQDDPEAPTVLARVVRLETAAEIARAASREAG